MRLAKVHPTMDGKVELVILSKGKLFEALQSVPISHNHSVMGMAIYIESIKNSFQTYWDVITRPKALTWCGPQKNHASKEL